MAHWKAMAGAPTGEGFKLLRRGPRLAVWCRKRGYRIGSWDRDRNSTSPKPMWRTEGSSTSADRKDPPIYWDYLPAGPLEDPPAGC